MQAEESAGNLTGSRFNSPELYLKSAYTNPVPAICIIAHIKLERWDCSTCAVPPLDFAD